MSSLAATLIDVGWGDSILIESEDSEGITHRALVDSNDTSTLRSSYIFIKRHLEKRGIKLPDDKPIFDFVMLSHPHADHGQGLKAIMREFGTKAFWYPKSTNWSSQAYLISYANASTNVGHHQSVDATKILPRLGDVDMEILWPPYDHIEPDENNNSIVLRMKLDQVSFVLTGDAESRVWSQISNGISDVSFFKIPHHGSINGTFDDAHNTPWYDCCSKRSVFGISSHVRPFDHPDKDVLQLLENDNRRYYRTDEHYHVTFQTNGTRFDTKYSHF